MTAINAVTDLTREGDIALLTIHLQRNGVGT